MLEKSPIKYCDEMGNYENNSQNFDKSKDASSKEENLQERQNLWKMLFLFSGRYRRIDLWGICFFSYFVGKAIESPCSLVVILACIISLPLTWVQLASIVKRCHDLGRSGYFALLLFVPIINFFVIVYIYFFKGQLKDNKYGKSPY